MTDVSAISIGSEKDIDRIIDVYRNKYEIVWRVEATISVLFITRIFSQIDVMLKCILKESIKSDLALSDTHMGSLTRLAFAVCYSLLSLPLARAADRGSPRFVLVSCILLWSAMTALGGIAASFLFLAFTRFGVAFGEAGAIPAGHALIAREIRPERRGLAMGMFAPLGTMIGSGLLAPLIVGMISDSATAAGIHNGLGLGLLVVPVSSVLTGIALLTANRRVAVVLQHR